MNEGIADCGHASNGRYSMGCRCDACRREHALSVKRRELRALEGRSYFVDADPVRARLSALYAAGYTQKEIARFGVSRSTQHALTTSHNRTGRPIKRVRRTTAERLESISGRRLSPHQHVPADAARHMVRAWRDGGVSIARVARVTGVNRQTLDALAHGKRDTVLAGTLDRLLSHREELDDLTRPAPRRRRGDALSARLSDWEVEEAYSRHEAGATLAVLAMQYHTSAKHLRCAFGRLEERREARACRA